MNDSTPIPLLVASAYGPEDLRGNATTCRRYVAAATRGGFAPVWVHGEGEALVAAVAEAVKERRPRLLHGHHALRAGPALAATGLPFVLTEGGTEFELLELRPELEPVLREVASAARRVLFAGPAALEAWVSRGFVDRSKTGLVPRGIVAPFIAPPPRDRSARGPLRTCAGLDAGRFLVLLPSGLRPGKDPLRAVAIMDLLRARGVDGALAVLGLRIDPAISEAMDAASLSRPWLSLPEPFGVEEMDAAYADADVVLNTSRFEGVANALLEAQAASRPVLAHAIPANALAVREGVGGALFTDDEQAADILAAWEGDAALRAALGAAGHAYVKVAHSADAEAAALVAAYRAAI